MLCRVSSLQICEYSKVIVNLRVDTFPPLEHNESYVILFFFFTIIFYYTLCTISVLVQVHVSAQKRY